jgi:hypothetical protein
MFVLVYDEWGGFFDHVHPPVVPDARASSDDGNNFSQLGFRVPSLLASPYARPGYVDHNLYDHASILRFLERDSSARPRRARQERRPMVPDQARPIRQQLRRQHPDDQSHPRARLPHAAAGGGRGRPRDDEDRIGKLGPDGTPRNAFQPTETLDAIVRERYAWPSFRPWLEYTNVRNVPQLPDDRPAEPQ